MNIESDGFTVVKGNRTRRNPAKSIHRTTSLSDKNSHIDIDATQTKIYSAVEELKQSEFIQNIFNEDVMSSPGFQQIYCFGLGQLNTVISRYQTAFFLIMKERYAIKSESCFAFDPVHCEDEKTLLRKLGVTAIEKNTQCKQNFEKKSLIILPHCPKELTNNLLFANYKSKTQENIILMANSISNILLRSSEEDLKKLCNVIESVGKSNLYTEYPIKNSFRFDDIFNDLSIHEFKAGYQGFADSLPEPDYTDSSSELS